MYDLAQALLDIAALAVKRDDIELGHLVEVAVAALLAFRTEGDQRP